MFANLKDQRPKTKDLSLRTERGFTLIELSVVIVIIGLIVAGVVGGQSLVEQAKIRSVLNQMNKIKIAVNSYKLEYGELPGDHTRATDYWGQAANCNADMSGSTNTCNGNGNKHITHPSSGNDERWIFWKHLENAGLIEGNYTGYSDSSLCLVGTNCLQPGINAPKGAFSGSGWFAFSPKDITNLSWVGRPFNRERNIIAFVNPGNALMGDFIWDGPALRPKHQYLIDKKIDDGLPFNGQINDQSGTNSWWSPDCTTTNSNEFGNTPPGTTTINTPYDLTNESIACTMFVDLE